MDLASFLSETGEVDNGAGGDSWGSGFVPEDLTAKGNVLDIGSSIQATGTIPDNGPFTAKIAHFPEGCTEEDIEDFFVEGMGITDRINDIEEVRAPRDQLGNMRNFAFITFPTRALLEKALTLNDRHIGQNMVYVSVAAPPKEKRPRREDSSFDFAGSRGSMQQREPERRFGGASERGPRREFQEDFDFAAVRGSAVAEPAARRDRFGGDRPERAPRREENLDFASIRGSAVQQEFERRDRFEREERKPRRDDNLDFAAIRGSVQPQQEFERRPQQSQQPRRPRTEDKLDFSSIRGSMQQPSVPVRNSAKKSVGASTDSKKKADAPVASRFAMLSVEDDEDDE